MAEHYYVMAQHCVNKNSKVEQAFAANKSGELSTSDIAANLETIIAQGGGNAIIGNPHSITSGCQNTTLVQDCVGNAKDLPCCQVYVPRTNVIPSILPPNIDNEVEVANRFPFWGLWRTPSSPPLPEVYYPGQVLPLSVCTKSWSSWPSGPNYVTPNLSPNWAFNK